MASSADSVDRLNAALEGRYRIEREIGEGGMATVFLAEDLRHERKVALKVLKPELAAVVGAERFLAEIKTTANLQHPHILPLHDSGEADGFLYFVMPFVEGDTLRDKIDREKQLSVEEALRITEKVASALDYAHEHGVVHRDIKPANILLSERGEPTVADFGIALAVAQAGGGRVTETGLSVGTPHYMSPEQATGDRDVDPRTDVYALGSVLYEMLTGEPPYPGGTAQAVLAKILTDPAPAPTKVRVSIPPNVDAAIRKSLEKLPADRFANAQEFARALGDPAFRHGESVTAEASVDRASWSPLQLAVAGLAVFFGLGFGWSLLRPDPPQPVSRQYVDTTGWAGPASQFARRMALAPDGSSMILPIEAEGVGYQLALKMRNSTEIAPIPGTEGARDVVYSPDGEWVAYSVGTDLFKRPLVGGSPLRIAEDTPSTAGVVGLSWLDDGTILYEQFGAAEGLSTRRVARISEDGGEPLGVIFGLGEEEVAVVWVHGLPGARGALVIACPGTTCLPEATQLHIVDLEDRSSEILLEQVLRAWYAPTGHIVYVRSDGAVLAQPFDLDRLELTGSAIPLFEGVNATAASSSALANAVLGADGTLFIGEGSAVGGEGDRLVVVDLEGNPEALPLAPRPIGWVGWSPDGESIVYDSEGQIYVYNVALGTTPRQLTFEGNNTMGVFSPSGTRVVFSSQREGTAQSDLFVKNLDDDSPPRSLISLEGAQLPTQWPSDTLILFEWVEGATPNLGMLDMSDPENPRAEMYLSSEAALFDLLASPDGSLAAYRSNESGTFEIYIRSFPDPGVQTLVSEGQGIVPFWSPDGNTLYYARSALQGVGGTMMAARLRRDPVPMVLSTESLFSGAYGQPFSGSPLHPDGDRFIFTQAVASAESADSEPLRLLMVTNFFEELRQMVPD